jgi:hypothetical protein
MRTLATLDMLSRVRALFQSLDVSPRWAEVRRRCRFCARAFLHDYLLTNDATWR